MTTPRKNRSRYNRLVNRLGVIAYVIARILALAVVAHLFMADGRGCTRTAAPHSLPYQLQP